MFSTISWQQYFTLVGFALLAYYIVVAIKFFKWEVLALAGVHKEEATKFSNVTIPKFSTNQDGVNEESEINLSPVLQDFRDEIGAYLIEASTDKLSNSEVIQGLQSIVAKYPVLNTASQIMSRNEIIGQELEGTPFATIRYHEL